MNANIITYKDYVAGWLDSSLHDFLPFLPVNDASIKYALITCLDSNSRPAALRDNSPELRPIAKRLHVVGNALLLPTELLIDTDSRRQLLFGFDEVWFFPSDKITPKPKTASLIGPARLKRARFKPTAKWMSENCCALAFGGGEGLNYIVQAPGLPRFLLGYSIKQSQPATASLATVGIR